MNMQFRAAAATPENYPAALGESMGEAAGERAPGLRVWVSCAALFAGRGRVCLRVRRSLV